MNVTLAPISAFRPLDQRKFRDPDLTHKGERRATVSLASLDTLWINTGSLCDIACRNCYIESSPRNDRLAYFALADALELYDEIARLDLPTREIGFTGGEPFLNHDLVPMAEAALARGFRVLILTNALRPMRCPLVQRALLHAKDRFGSKLKFRVSLDHHTPGLHESERGDGTWARALEGIDWLVRNGFEVAIAGRTRWGEPETLAREGYRTLFAERAWPIDASDPSDLILFPEMDATVDVPEITTACWGILGKSPANVMCARSRMVVRRKGAGSVTVLPCTLIPYDPAFEMGSTLAEAARAEGGNFERGAVKLNHPHCAKFCVLGGGSCSA